MGDDAARIIYILMALVLVGSSLMVRRLPAGNMVKLALIWVAIFAGAFLIIRLVTGMS